MFNSIWTEGMELTQEDGTIIKLSSVDLQKIRHTMDASNGQSSFEYALDIYADDLDYYNRYYGEGKRPITDDIRQEIADLEAKYRKCLSLMKDENACYEVWNDYLETCFFDTGAYEIDAVEGVIEIALYNDTNKK